jgi:V/A-type H+-transporting ATPase subunit C
LAKIKDTDYLFLSTRIRALERNLLSRDRMERMLDAQTAQDAAKILVECGYPEVEEVTASSITAMLATVRQRTFDDLYLFAPDRNIIDVFKVKYDYHNAKVLLKSEALGIDSENLLVDTGRVPVEKLKECIHASDFRGLPGALAGAIQQARETLGNTRDPQLADFVLDNGYFDDLFALAKASESAFLAGYVRINIDAVNLKTLVRTQRMGKDADFLRTVIFTGGNVDRNRIIQNVSSGSAITELYATSVLKDAAEAGVAAAAGGGLTTFEKLCDDAVMAYVKDAKYVAFGEAPVVAYLAAKESELVAARIILTGRLAGLPADTIRERLRDSYV